jgi:DNA invertase Pin-like site-specific DNA recombinase
VSPNETTVSNDTSKESSIWGFGAGILYPPRFKSIKKVGKAIDCSQNLQQRDLSKGDSLVVTELSRMTRSLKHLLQLVEYLEKLGMDIISLRENIDTSTATGRCFISIIGAIAQMERELKSERAAARREAAIARGQSGGRPRTDPKKLEQATILYNNSKQTAAEVCKAVGVGRRTFFRYLSRKREKEKAEI